MGNCGLDVVFVAATRCNSSDIQCGLPQQSIYSSHIESKHPNRDADAAQNHIKVSFVVILSHPRLA